MYILDYFSKNNLQNNKRFYITKQCLIETLEMTHETLSPLQIDLEVC